LQKQERDFKRLGVKIVVVTFEPGSSARSYRDEMGLGWPLLIDGSKELYRSYGMRTASLWDIWGPKSWWAYGREILKGNTPTKSAADIYQRGGDVLIDQGGMVRLHHVGAGSADRPSLDVILDCRSRGRD
jgi:hypothetical protein